VDALCCSETPDDSHKWLKHAAKQHLIKLTEFIDNLSLSTFYKKDKTNRTGCKTIRMKI
jgi:hypothetical protein